MKKLATFVLMLCLTLSGAFCHARCEARTELKEDGKDPEINNFTYWTPNTSISPCPYWLFYQSGYLTDEPCLCEDELNCEWFNINKFIVLDDGELHYSPNYNSPYFYCTVNDKYLMSKIPYEICDRYHTARVCYAKVQWEGPYPD